MCARPPMAGGHYKPPPHGQASSSVRWSPSVGCGAGVVVDQQTETPSSRACFPSCRGFPSTLRSPLPELRSPPPRVAVSVVRASGRKSKELNVEGEMPPTSSSLWRALRCGSRAQGPPLNGCLLDRHPGLWHTRGQDWAELKLWGVRSPRSRGSRAWSILPGLQEAEPAGPVSQGSEGCCSASPSACPVARQSGCGILGSARPVCHHCLLKLSLSPAPLPTPVVPTLARSFPLLPG